MAETIKCPGSGCDRDIPVGHPSWGEVQCECGQVVVNRPGSVLHGRPVVNKPLAEVLGKMVPQGGSVPLPKAPPPLEVVGKCPSCGAPVYGRKEIAADDKYPKVVYSCLCRNNDLMRTK